MRFVVEPGTTLAERYRVVQHIDEGGMGTVLAAYDTVLDRMVALKVVSRDDEIAQQFEHEARLVLRLDHPNIVPVHDFVMTDAYALLVMPFLRGQTLRDVLERDAPLPAATVVHLACQIARALAHSHTSGVVHRDVKPDNVMVLVEEGDRTSALLMDYGIAIAAGESVDLDRPMGTPAYMSPEQIAGTPIGPATDLFAFGVMLYECLSGRNPFEADNIRACLANVFRVVPTNIAKIADDVPPALGRLIGRCLEKQPAHRPQSAEEVAEVLEALREGLQAPRVSQVPASESMAGIVATNDQGLSSVDRLFVRGEYEAAAELVEWARRLDQLRPADEAAITLRIAQLAHRLGRYDVALQHCAEGLALSVDDAGMSARLQAEQALIQCSVGDFDAAAHACELGWQALERAPPEQCARAEAALGRARGNVMMGLGRWSAAARDYQRCVELIDPELFAWEASVATFNAGEALALAGEHEEGIRWLERADRDKGAIGDLWGLAYVHAVRADLALELGHPGTMGFAQNSLSFATSVRDPKIRSRGRTCVGRAELAIDAFERAEHTLHKAMFEAQHCRAKPEAAQAAIALTELAFTRGRLRQAREQARVALQRAESTRAALVLMPALFWMAVTHRGTPAAAEHLAAAHRQLDAQPGPMRRLDLSWADAWLADDERLWLQVLEQAARLDARRHLASASEQLALCLARSGRSDDARHHAQRAASSYGAMGARRRRARCERFHAAMARR